MKYDVVWFGGVRHVARWTIVPWVSTDADGWVFTWGFITLGRYKRYFTYVDDNGDEE